MATSLPDASSKPLRIGVLYEEVQLTDLAGLDILGNMSSRIVSMVSNLIPAMEQLKPYARDMEFLYISSSTELAWATPDMYIRPTHTYDSAPRDLDIILLGGPDPQKVSEASLIFLREASKQTKAILATCTGGMWLAKSGILDGKKATTNRLLLDAAKHVFPNVEWQDERWVAVDGHFEGAQLWTSGGAKCGRSNPCAVFTEELIIIQESIW
jgi:transcriptional regulator GlxA family with amidase domain